MMPSEGSERPLAQVEPGDVAAMTLEHHEPMTNGGILELRDEGMPGYRHYLDGEPVRCGTLLDIQLADGKSWLPGRYEWSGRPDDQPTFFIAIAAGKSPADYEQVAFRLPPQAILRWPES